jgi:hypothetical protein
MGEPFIDPERLSKWDTNDLFKMVQRRRFPVMEFDLITQEYSDRETTFAQPPPPKRKRREREKTSPKEAAVIHHLPTRSYFGVTKKYEGHYIYTWEVGRPFSREILSDKFKGSGTYQWSAVRYQFDTWLNHIEAYVNYLNEPDLWGELARLREALANIDFENTSFTLAEQVAISARIKQAKDYVRTSHELTQAQISRIEAGLDHAEAASGRIGRKDWLLMVTGSILGLILTDAITPPVANSIFMLVVHGLGHFFGLSSPPPQLPGTGLKRLRS